MITLIKPAARAVVAAAAAAAVLLTAGLGSDHHAAADAITDKIAAAQQNLAAGASAAAHLRAELAAAADQQVALMKVIADLDAQIGTAEKQVSDTQTQLDAIGTALSIAQDNLAVTQEKLVADRRTLAIEAVVIYKAENASTTFSNFLNSGDFNAYWQRVLDVKQQTQLLDAQRGIVAQLDAGLAARKQAQARLAAVQLADQQQLAVNEAAQRQKQAEIAALQAEEAAALAAGGGNGHFAWPETGPISQGFGCTSYPFEPYDPNCPSKHFHSGIDIAAPCGTSIAAADSGIAHTYYSSWGYGNHIIIDHGHGWVSVYGHMSSLVVGNGQTVHRGQLIGYEGSTGNSTGCHLHFEVDLNGNPMNPLAYLS
jgi:murein DD-endopeptidase MepM/ murein hydrolase activator NlpD